MNTSSKTLQIINEVSLELFNEYFNYLTTEKGLEAIAEAQNRKLFK